MDQATKDNIQLGATEAVGIINTVLPFLKTALPIVRSAGGPIGMGIAALEALVPLIQRIPTNDPVSLAAQAAQLKEIEDITQFGFTGPEWKKSTDSADPVAT
jgi:hypothetical protein